MSASPAQLPCGVALDVLVAQVADREPPADIRHQAACPYCQDALRSLDAAWADLRTLVREPVFVPPELTARILTRIRELAGQVAGGILIGYARGHTRISHAVVAHVVRRLALEVPDVLFASAKPVPLSPPEPAQLTVVIRLVIAFGPAVDALAGAVRAALDRRLTALTGAELTLIDIVVDDIVDVDRP